MSPLSVIDELAIRRLVHRYADAVVHRDASQWAECWAQDARWDLGGDRFVEGRAAIVQLWLRAMSGFTAVVQLVHNGEVMAGDGDSATGRWYIDERYRRADGASGVLLAHYDDTYTRTPDGWRFASRRLQAHYNGSPDLTAAFANTSEALTARGLSPDV